MAGPLVLFVILMGIGMDYNVFIPTRIREEVHKGKEIKEAVVDAVDWTGGIITALACIMAGAFGSIMRPATPSPAVRLCPIGGRVA